MNPLTLGMSGLPSDGEIKAQFSIIHGLVRRGAIDSERARQFRRVLLNVHGSHRSGHRLVCNAVIAELVVLLDKSPGRNYNGGTHTPRVWQERYYPLAHAEVILPMPAASIGPTHRTPDADCGPFEDDDDPREVQRAYDRLRGYY